MNLSRPFALRAAIICVAATGCGSIPARAPIARLSSTIPSQQAFSTSPPAPSAAPQAPAPAASHPAAVGAFSAAIGSVGRERLPYSWREGCPVRVSDLRLLTLSFWGFDSKVHQGELVVHRDHSDKIVLAMRKLFDQRFPVEKMDLIDKYQADDDRSVEANNTSAFNCRKIEGTQAWSEHAFGRALDINPVQNPFVLRNGEVKLPSGRPYADRSQRLKGMIRPNGGVVNAFRSIGWSWGGNWTNSKDYQHFSATGR